MWKIIDERPVFTPITLGRSDLDGYVQVIDGLAVGDTVVLYNDKALTAKSRLRISKRLAGVSQ